MFKVSNGIKTLKKLNLIMVQANSSKDSFLKEELKDRSINFKDSFPQFAWYRIALTRAQPTSRPL
jgi:hypothetical protein